MKTYEKTEILKTVAGYDYGHTVFDINEPERSETMKVLKTELKVTIKGKPCSVNYRAVVAVARIPEQGTEKQWRMLETHQVLLIEQQVGGVWHPTPGRWIVSSRLLTALAGGLWIDFGLGWRIEPNEELMHEVLDETLGK